jgi:conjugative relaxase-like TrwC/TraI family protein
MLDMVRIDSVDYYQTLAKSEYYASEKEGGEPPGAWGEGCEKIGIDTSQPVQNSLLKIVMTGHKADGTKMVQNAGQEGMRVGMDLTFSAPKSVSVLWANASPELREQISQAQATAVAEAMRYLRDRVETRTGKNGEQRERPAGLIFAMFEHCDTREKDPQLHTHTVVSNSVVRENGKTSAIDQKGLYDHKLAAGTTYRASLAQQLRAMGFKIEEDKENAGIFQVAGFDKNLEKHFSKRSEQIKKMVEVTGRESAQSRRNFAQSTKNRRKK